MKQDCSVLGCTAFLLRGAVCGSNVTSLTVYADLGGGCAWKAGPPDSSLPNATCSGPIFSSECGSFAGSLSLIITPGNVTDALFSCIDFPCPVPIFSPQSGGLWAKTTGLRTADGPLCTYCTGNATLSGVSILGLENIAYVGSLSIALAGTPPLGSPDNIYDPYVISFLGALEEVGGDLTITGAMSDVVSIVLPLGSLRQVRGRVAITNTRLAPSLQSVVCVGQSLAITGNMHGVVYSYEQPLIWDLVNLSSIYSPLPAADGTVINISNNKLVYRSPWSLAALARVGNCGGAIAQGQNIRVDAWACAPPILITFQSCNICSPFLTWDALCNYVATNTCQAKGQLGLAPTP
jgi:hypothetical protein